MTTKQKVLIGAGVLVLAGFAYARARKPRASSTASDPRIEASVECVSGDCTGAPASTSWLSSSAPDKFLYLEPWDV